MPAMGLELWTFCLADQRLRPLGHNTLLYVFEHLYYTAFLKSTNNGPSKKFAVDGI